mmetsp:Transcript_35166/g.60213  ORF Transcript_35166/g.60213 Transcript_35166/m.60213 type:complete len:261 (+) Transcript_35166:301-1083(+)
MTRSSRFSLSHAAAPSGGGTSCVGCASSALSPPVMYLARSVCTTPGWRATALPLAPAACSRLCSSSVKSTLAAFETPYAPQPPAAYSFGSSLSARDAASAPLSTKRCASEETLTTRKPSFARCRAGSSAATSAKWPRWLMPTVFSKPSAVSCRSGTAITPALLISTSMVGASVPRAASSREGSDLTDFRSARSSSTPTAASARDVDARISLTAASALALERAATTTFAPAEARRLADSSPRPVLAPVMKMVVPVRELAGG